MEQDPVAVLGQGLLAEFPQQALPKGRCIAEALAHSRPVIVSRGTPWHKVEEYACGLWVDNNPASGLTPPVVAEFPGVRLVNEPRKGASYARNKGIITSRGDLVTTTDDDVTLPPDWLEKLVAH